MSALITGLMRQHNRFFDGLGRATNGWFTGFAARFAFTSVLFLYYMNSAIGKLGEGFFGFLHPNVGAYVSILPPIMEKYNYDVSAIPFFPWHIIVYAGTWTEILLPIFILIGLFSRLSAIAMIGFIVVQTYVDIAFLGLEGKYIGAMFDRFQDAVVWDQRFLWCFVLIIIIVHGPGKLSLDYVLSKRFSK